ncbi:MAG: biotin--[acetyl-CoA-carboxylase] ligase [Tannerella sp.]|jgi:BirA family biotin operon repressor/biotin-[acetyl-CoA-carboxylase] ligase|nr:biotin--[acetyl-CoA-carboxylase] ligase [Tannerella sp.]
MNDLNTVIISLAETDSTNRYLQSVAANEVLPSGSIVIAGYQTSGRGQTGNSWESERGKNLLFSVLLRPAEIPANKSFVISEAAALSVKYTLDKYVADITVKWPNDIYFKDSKIAGILIENVINQGKISQSVIGFGININQTEFNAGIYNPLSLSMISGVEYDIEVIFNEFREKFAVLSEMLADGQFEIIHQKYINSLYRKEGFHRFSDAGGVFDAEIFDIEPSGHLVLHREDGTLSRYAFKEIKFEMA